MKKFLFTFLIILFFKNLLITHSAQALKNEEKFVEIQKCIFLENQLIPSQKYLTPARKIFKNIYPIVISFLIAHVIYKILYFAQTKIIPQKANKQIPKLNSSLQKIRRNAEALKQFSQNPSKEIKISQNKNTPQNKSKQKNGYNISFVFGIASPIYLLIKFLVREKELTQLQILTNFIKNWQDNKISIPQKFNQRFDCLYQIYQNENSLNLTELESEKIIRTTIMEIIDYKIELQSNFGYKF